MIKSDAGLKGEVRIIVRRSDGSVEEHSFRNVITDAGKTWLLKLGFTDETARFRYIAIGTGTTPESSSDTALENEIVRVNAGVEFVTIDTNNDAVRLHGVFDSSVVSGLQSITEAGVFNDASGGVLLARRVFPVINVDFDAGDVLEIFWTIQLKYLGEE